MSTNLIHERTFILMANLLNKNYVHEGPSWASCGVYLIYNNQYIILYDVRMQKYISTKIFRNLVQKWACKNEFIGLTPKILGGFLKSKQPLLKARWIVQNWDLF